MARGTRETEGYRSLFPIIHHAVEADEPDSFDPSDLSEFYQDRKVGAPAWGLANPIYIDIDGDGFKAKYVVDGASPLR